jgi:bifunctional DNA-binding transcriptional regulator/antitoxin component of YhaV-PrlF toxin-antitoxin module
MQLQKQLNRIVDNKEYSKYLLVIPPQAIEELQWKEGEELEHEVKDQTLIIRKAKVVDERVMKIARKHLRVMRK